MSAYFQYYLLHGLIEKEEQKKEPSIFDNNKSNIDAFDDTEIAESSWRQH